MNTAFSAHQRSYDSRMPPEEPDIEKRLELLDKASNLIAMARASINRTRPAYSTHDGYVEEAISALQDIPTGDTP